MKKMRIIRDLKRCAIGLLGVAAVLGGIVLLPGTIEGSYRGRMTQCMCDSMNFVRFHDGKVFSYSSKHPPARLIGRYERNWNGSTSVYMFPIREGETEKLTWRVTPHLLPPTRFVSTSGEPVEWLQKVVEKGEIQKVIDAQEVAATMVLQDGTIKKTFYDISLRKLRVEMQPSRKSKAEQAGADQPATKPADKAPVKDQSSTPTSEDAPGSRWQALDVLPRKAYAT